MDHNLCNEDSVLVLNSSFIKENVPMSRAIELMETAFRMLSDHNAYIPKRVVMTTPDESLSIFFKPAFMSQYKRLSIKILTQILDNDNPDLPTIKGVVMLIDTLTGRILSLTDGTYLTALRTGAASGIATSYLANRDSSSLAVFGCGAQGRTQVEAVMAVRPIKKVCLFDPAYSKAVRLGAEIFAKTGLSCDINPDPGILKDIDVICTATPGNTPLFRLNQLKPGVHINAVGSFRPDMHELDPKIFGAGLIYLDDAPACISGSGDILNPINLGIIREEDITGELGALIGGSIPGRRNSSDITIFKSVGNAIQDFFVANEAYDKSISLKEGQIIKLVD